MDKNAEKTINDLARKIEALQAKKEAVLKKEKERKAKAQDKWKGIFIKEMTKHIISAFGEDYEEILSPEMAAAMAGDLMGEEKEAILLKAGVKDTPDTKEGPPEDITTNEAKEPMPEDVA